MLIVEDNPSDIYLIQRAIERTRLPVDFHIARDGHQAIQFLDETEADPVRTCPDLVILDINLPKRPGGDVLKHMHCLSRSANAHVIVVSTSDSEHERTMMKKLGANDYFPKPSDFEAFMKLGDLVKAALLAL